MISSLNFSLFPSDELYTFSKNVIAICEPKRTAILPMVPFLDKTQEKYDLFQASRERESANPLIKLQTQTDKLRKQAYVSLRDLNESASKRTKVDVAESGARLKTVFRKYGWTIQTNGQKSRTAIISDVISEIQNKYMADLKLVGGEELLAELRQAESNYEAIAKKVVEDESANNDPKVADTRPELVIALKSLFQILSLQETAAPSDELSALNAAINQLITTSVASVKAADTRAENAKKKATDASSSKETE